MRLAHRFTTPTTLWITMTVRQTVARVLATSRGPRLAVDPRVAEPVIRGFTWTVGLAGVVWGTIYVLLGVPTAAAFPYGFSIASIANGLAYRRALPAARVRLRRDRPRAARADRPQHLSGRVHGIGRGGALVAARADRPGLIDRVFDPFVTTKAPGEGTGLGLNICHQIVVERHHGRIIVDSEPGRTRFVVRLPIEHPAHEDSP